MQAVRPVVRSVVARQGARRAYHAPSDLKITTINDLPSPQGSWQDVNNARQRKYNITLVAGVATLATTIIALKASGLNLYSSPPTTWE